ncbi:MAG: hypothetical protein HZA79_01235 [Sphingobacteriales bacterium]|nr:hypothetical protein [Sphingobacteriales bacterium]
MKKILFILSLLFISTLAAKAQEEDGDDRIRDKMREYIQLRLKLNKDEADRFTPVFIRYFREWRTALKENRSDRLILQQKVVELRLRYRGEFKEIIGERRSNEVFKRQDDFIQELKTIRQERMRDRQAPRRIRIMID